LKPVSAARVTITASGPRRSARRCAPTTFAPEEMPAKMPSSRERRTSGLFDVVGGSNGTCAPAYLCTGVAGYDGPTGLGTPNGATGF
jgi:hypothetical protein